MFNDIVKGFKELASKTALKTIGQSVGAVLVSKNLPGVIQYGANKLAGQNIDLSGPIPALSSAVLVSSYCFGKGWKIAGTTTLAYAGAEQIIPYWNKVVAGALDQPLVLPVTSSVSAGVSDSMYRATPLSDDMETITFPGADGQPVQKQLESVNSGMSEYVSDLNQVEGVSDYIDNLRAINNGTTGVRLNSNNWMNTNMYGKRQILN